MCQNSSQNIFFVFFSLALLVVASYCISLAANASDDPGECRCISEEITPPTPRGGGRPRASCDCNTTVINEDGDCKPSCLFPKVSPDCITTNDTSGCSSMVSDLHMIRDDDFGFNSHYVGLVFACIFLAVALICFIISLCTCWNNRSNRSNNSPSYVALY